MLLIRPVISCLSQNSILNVEWELIKQKLFLGLHFSESPIWHKATVGSADPTFSRISPSTAFVIFIVILLTQFPTQHRYTDRATDLWITKIPYKAIPARELQRGRLSNDLVSETFFFFPGPFLEGTQLNFQSKPINLTSPQRPIFMSKHKTQSGT